MTVAGLILAAGRSSRMGRPKALLELHGIPYLERLLAAYDAAGIETMLVILGPSHAGEIRARLDLTRATVIMNPQQDSPMLRSIQMGIESTPSGCDAVLMQPVDLPLVDESVIRPILRVNRMYHPAAVIPMYRARTGHPVLLARTLFPEILALDQEHSLRDLLYGLGPRAMKVGVANPALRLDADRPEDLALIEDFARGRRPRTPEKGIE